MDNKNPEVTISFKYIEKDLYYILKDTYRIRKIPHIIAAILIPIVFLVLYANDTYDSLFMSLFLVFFLTVAFIIGYRHFLKLNARNSYNNDKGFQELQYIEIYNDKIITVIYENATVIYFAEMNKYYEAKHEFLIVQNPLEKTVFQNGNIKMPPMKIITIPKKYCDKESLYKIKNILSNSGIPQKQLL